MSKWTLVIVSAGSNPGGSFLSGPVLTTLDFDDQNNCNQAVTAVQNGLLLNNISAPGVDIRSTAVVVQTCK